MFWQTYSYFFGAPAINDNAEQAKRPLDDTSPALRKAARTAITKACEKRPVTVDQIKFIVDSIENSLKSEYEREVPSQEIGAKVMQHLQKVDEVAYVRFASVYRRYRDVNQFLSEVEGLIGRD